MDNKNMKRLKQILHTSIISIFVNVGLGIFKAIIGVITHSIAITTDAVNNLTDAGSSLITILSSYFASKDSDKKHPFGYGRYEYIGTLLIGGIIFYAGITSVVESAKGIVANEPAEYTNVLLIIIAVAVFVKLALSLYIMRIGKKVNSDSLVASGKEALGDVAISVATVIAAMLSLFLGISIEAYLGIVIGAMIVKTGVETLKETLDKILGVSGEVELVKSIKKTIASHDKVKGAYDLILHNYGPETYMGSVHIAVDDTLSINELDMISREIHEQIYKEYNVVLSAIGIYSVNTSDKCEKIRTDIEKLVIAKEYINSIHGFYYNEDKKQISLDIVVSFSAKDRRSVYSNILEELNRAYPEYEFSLGFDTDFNEI